MTLAERLLWERLRNNGIGDYHFRRQQIIAGFIVDFYCRRAGLIVELDGPVHDRNPEADAERDAILKGMGFEITHFNNEDVFGDINGVIRRIMQAINSDPPPPPLTPPPPLPLREGEEGDGGRGR
jgi:very-short-patch-repair endonuclease